jgi:nucleotide-binding universal stress UspA family protein
MKTILVPLDGSTYAEQVVPYARMLAATLKMRLYLLRVIPAPMAVSAISDDVAELSHSLVGPRLVSTAYSTNQSAQQQGIAATYLATQAEHLRYLNIPFDIDVQLGDPAETIVELAEREQAAMIVMASHGLNGLQRWLPGSVTTKVAQRAPCPVLVMRSSMPLVTQPRLRRILVPFDGSQFALQALPHAREIASHAAAEILLVHVMPVSLDHSLGDLAANPHFTENDPRYQEAHQQLEQAAKSLGSRHIKVSTYIASGYVPDMIIETANREQCDLIVMATHGTSGWRRWALGSVTDRVLKHSTTPLLVIHQRHAG